MQQPQYSYSLYSPLANSFTLEELCRLSLWESVPESLRRDSEGTLCVLTVIFFSVSLSLFLFFLGWHLISFHFRTKMNHLEPLNSLLSLILSRNTTVYSTSGYFLSILPRSWFSSPSQELLKTFRFLRLKI